ncbi:MAG: 3-hydroxybutyryl-CoA dehydrogenase [Chloroflexia bacterium]|nr:3-hydroxybutyryl-CoA dehydrogenase [Chloroflexia bacterium]
MTKGDSTVIAESAPILRVLIVGAGTMGTGIAQVIAEAGIDTVLHDSDPNSLSRGRSAIVSRWQRMTASAKRTAADVAAFEQRLTAGGIQDAAGADLIIEAIVEKLEAKTELFALLATIAPPPTLFASNTSSIAITALGNASGRPDRFVGMHFFNPVPVLPLVEIVRGQETSEATIQTSVSFAEKIGKSPVLVNDAPGFVANRILLPMINEAVFALQEGVATKEAIDKIMKLGMAHPMGPLALADLIGLDICLDILETLHRDFGDDKYRPAPLLRRMVAAGTVGRKSGRGFYEY